MQPNIRDIIYDLSSSLMPPVSYTNSITPKKRADLYKSTCDKLLSIIVGMTLANSISAEKIKELAEAIKDKK